MKTFRVRYIELATGNAFYQLRRGESVQDVRFEFAHQLNPFTYVIREVTELSRADAARFAA